MQHLWPQHCLYTGNMYVVILIYELVGELSLNLISFRLHFKLSKENPLDAVKLPISCLKTSLGFLPLKIVEYFIVKVTFSALYLSTEYNP